MGSGRIPGAVTLVAHRGRVVQHECYGVMDRETGRPMRADVLFRLYSMSKPITCAALMALCERGLLRLLDPVAEYLPSFSRLKVFAGGTAADPKLIDLERSVTIRDLLTHTAGFTYHFFEYGPVEQMYRDAGLWQATPLARFVDDLLRLPLAFQPGSAFRYSVAHDVLARVIEVVSGRPFETYLDETIFRPLGMHDTGFVVPSPDLGRFVSMYGPVDVPRCPATASQAAEAALAAADSLLAGPGDSLESRPNECIRGGIGLVSTAGDYFSFCRMLLAGGGLDGARILGRKSVELMTANHLPPELLPYEVGGRYAPGYGYGFGVRVLMDVAQSQAPGSPGEFGWSGAATTSFWVDPIEELICMLMAQVQPSSATLIAQDFRAAVYQAIAD